ncbi:MAG TPA: ABC transporter substrate-binding protein [Candidatus Binatia bacterium]
MSLAIRFIVLLSTVLTISLWARRGEAQERPRPLTTLNASYASVTGSRIPLWIAKDAGLFEKYGLSVDLVVIAAGNTAIGALMGGDVDILGAPGTTSMVSAAKGLPIAIIGTFGPGAWKLAAHPSITSVEQLRGKTVGTSRPGTTIDFALRRTLLKLGLAPGKDVHILATGLAESIKRVYVMQQGKIDATLVSQDNLSEAETRGLKVSVLADLKDLGIYTSASDLSARREFIKANRARVKAFLAAYCEAIRLGKSNKAAALASFRKYMRESDPKRLEVLYKNYVDELLPMKPYPMEEVIQADIENLSPTMPEMRGKKPADFIDKTLLAELDEEGFFARLYK